ncbi:bifunctional nuclease family protein [soil metagenome]
MNKVQVDILGLSVSQASTGAYALILREIDGVRRLPIVIGVPEAQAIANELEGIKPQRPMTHDLLRNVIDALGGQLRDVSISSLRDGTFYATLHFEFSDLEVDARPSDAIALAIRCGVPMYVTEEIIAEAGFTPEGDEAEEEFGETHEEEPEEENEIERLRASSAESEPEAEAPPKAVSLRDRLHASLDLAIKNEEYEKAAQLRDQLNQLGE